MIGALQEVTTMPEVRILTEREVMGEKHAQKRPARANDLWLVATHNGKRERKKVGRPTLGNIDRAEELRADWQAALDQQLGVELPIPTFRAIAEDFLKNGMRARASKTVKGRTYQVNALVEHFGDTPLEDVDVEAFWNAFVEGRRDWRTGGFYLNALSLVFRHAQRGGHNIQNPVAAARARIIGDISTTKAFRRRNQENLNPLSTDQLRSLFAELEREPLDFVVSTFLLYECGLRFGEMKALEWGDVRLGKDADDTTRHIYVRNSETDGETGATKSGCFRKVGLSRRARAMLLRWKMQVGRPKPTDRVVRALWGKNFRNRLAGTCGRARIPYFTPKDFRDTYASHLITHGIVLKWVSLQLGHARVATTEKHYAAYMALEGYENPWHVPSGCLPTDLFAALDGWNPVLCQQGASILPTPAVKA
jgi:integrase